MFDLHVWGEGQPRMTRVVSMYRSVFLLAERTCLLLTFTVISIIMLLSPVVQIDVVEDCVAFNYKKDLLPLKIRGKDCVGPSRILPDVVVIGDRTGAVATLRYLNYLHPSVKSIGRTLHYSTMSDNDTSQLARDIKEMNGFPCPDVMTIWAPTRYYDAESLPKDIYMLNPRVKLIVALRDPIVRAKAEHEMELHCKGNGCANSNEDGRTFDERVNASDFNAIKRSLYAVHLMKWLTLFPRRAMHFVDTNLILVDPGFELHRVEKYLGLKPFIQRRMFTYNETRANMQICGSQMEAVYGHYQPPVDLETQRRLLNTFAPHVEKLRRIIGHGLSWMQRYQLKSPDLEMFI